MKSHSVHGLLQDFRACDPSWGGVGGGGGFGSLPLRSNCLRRVYQEGVKKINRENVHLRGLLFEVGFVG